MTGNLSVHPLRENRPRQISLSEIVEQEDALVFRFGRGSEGMQSATACMAEHDV